MNTPPLRRRTDEHGRLWRFFFGRENFYRDFWLFAVTLMVGWSLISAQKEVEQRRDQTCTVFEQEHNDEVTGLRKTYDYLTSLSPKQLKTPLNLAIVRQIPESEKRVKVLPPGYCAKPGVGLDKLLPLPKRPADLPS